ncbi:hypothetical protein [Nocardia sp. NPDC060249]|uniref:hypothetical protein n=1 Tax=Nocardia sp. NPDC060249 TaxID=3347082 RepID=UPI00365830BD
MTRPIDRSTLRQQQRQAAAESRAELENIRRAITSAVQQHHQHVRTYPDITDLARVRGLLRQMTAIERRINATTTLSETERGRAISALRNAHYAPHKPLGPIFQSEAKWRELYKDKLGYHNLKARAEAFLSRVRLGMLSPSDLRRLQRWEQLHQERAEQRASRPVASRAPALDNPFAGKPWNRAEAVQFGPAQSRDQLREWFAELPTLLREHPDTGRENIMRTMYNIERSAHLSTAERGRATDVLNAIVQTAREGKPFDRDPWDLVVASWEFHAWEQSGGAQPSHDIGQTPEIAAADHDRTTGVAVPAEIIDAMRAVGQATNPDRPALGRQRDPLAHDPNQPAMTAAAESGASVGAE